MLRKVFIYLKYQIENEIRHDNSVSPTRLSHLQLSNNFLEAENPFL